MKREELKALGLTDEQTDKVMDLNGDDINKYKGEAESAKSELGMLQNQLKENEKLIKQFEKDSKNNEELKGKVEQLTVDLEKTKTDAEDSLRELRIGNAIQMALTESGTKYADLLSSKFDREKITINDKGEVSGVKEQIESFKKDYADLFTATVTGNTPESGNKEPMSSGSGYDNLLKNADKMSAEEIAAAFSKLEK